MRSQVGLLPPPSAPRRVPTATHRASEMSAANVYQLWDFEASKSLRTPEGAHQRGSPTRSITSVSPPPTQIGMRIPSKCKHAIEIHYTSSDLGLNSASSSAISTSRRQIFKHGRSQMASRYRPLCTICYQCIQVSQCVGGIIAKCPVYQGGLEVVGGPSVEVAQGTRHATRRPAKVYANRSLAMVRA